MARPWRNTSGSGVGTPVLGVGSLRAFDVALFDPWHEAAEAFTDFFDVVLGFFFADFFEGLAAVFCFGNPLFGEFAGLDFLEGFLHSLLHGGVDDLGAYDDVSPFGGFRDGETHACDAGLVHEIDGELELVETFEVGHFWLVAGFYEGLVASLHKGADASAEDGLLAEEIGLGLFFEGGLKDAAFGAADSFGPGEGDFLGVFAGVLLDGDEGGDAFAFEVLAADDVTRAFGGDHDDVDVFRRDDGAVEDGEAVGEEECLSFGEVGGDVFGVDGSDGGVGRGDHDDVCLLGGFGGVEDFEAELFSDGAGFRFRVEANDDVYARFFEIEGVGVSLRAEADDGAGLAFEDVEVGVFVGVDFSGHIF